MLEEKLNFKEFYKKGYTIIPADNPDVLVEMRRKIFEHAKEMVAYKNEGVEEFFDKFHVYNLQGAELNEKRVKLIKSLTENLNIGKLIHDAFSNVILQLLGPDIVVQKNTNIVIQQPGDPNFSPTHRDAPENSPFEVTVWIPLTKVYGSKGMYVLDREKSEKALTLLSREEDGYEKFSEFGAEEGTDLEMSFGEALFFWPGLVHGIRLNTEDETRWALNIRYKNIFSPTGTKGLSEFFDILHLSPLTKIAFEFEKKELA